MKPYVEEFLYRGRCPDQEKGKEAAYHVVLAQFVTGPDGTPHITRTAPMTPKQADKAGFTLDRILGEVTKAALLERDAAIAAKDAALEAKEAAHAEKAAAVELAAKAEAAKDEALRQLGEMAKLTKASKEG